MGGNSVDAERENLNPPQTQCSIRFRLAIWFVKENHICRGSPYPLVIATVELDLFTQARPSCACLVNFRRHFSGVLEAAARKDIEASETCRERLADAALEQSSTASAVNRLRSARPPS